MTISKWEHPIKYLRLVTTPTCDRCKHFRQPLLPGCECTCVNEEYLEHISRLDGKRHERERISSVRGTRWCDFEPIEGHYDG